MNVISLLLEMSANGVPAFIQIQREVRRFQVQFEEKCRSIELQASQSQEAIREMFDALPQKVVDEVLRRIRVEGEKPFSLEDIRLLKTEL